MLDEPALTTSSVSTTPVMPRLPWRLAPRMGVERRHRAGGHPGADIVGPAGQDDRHPRAEHDAGGVGVGHERQVLGQHVAGLEIGHHQDLRLARHRRDDALDPRGLRADRVVQRQRAVEDAALDLAAIGHLAQGGGIEASRPGSSVPGDGQQRDLQRLMVVLRAALAHDLGQLVQQVLGF